jgi:hypothetical protein
MEEVRIRPLDNICKSIAETRGTINELRGEEAGLEQTALKLMREHRKTSWRHAGVELVRVPGEEKLRVRTSKANATAEQAADDIDDDLEAMDSQRGEDTGEAEPALERAGLEPAEV